MLRFLRGQSPQASQAPQAPRSPRSPRTPRTPRTPRASQAPRAPLASWRAPRAPYRRREPATTIKSIEYYTGWGKASNKSINFLNDLSQLNYLFPSLVETEFIEPEFKHRKNINFNILNRSPTLEFAKQVAKNYYLWLQVFDVSPGADPAGIRIHISKFLGPSTNSSQIYRFDIPNSDLHEFIIRGLQKMFPNTFNKNKSTTEISEQFVSLQNKRNIPQGNYYQIDNIGGLIESLVITDFATYFRKDREIINRAFVDNKYNINATYYYLESIKSLSAGGQYYRKRKTRKPKKTRKPRKTQRK